MKLAISRVLTENLARRSVRAREVKARARLERLSARESQVLAGLAAGQSSRAIAESLQISPRTVEIHRANMLNKTQVRNSAEAIRLAIEANFGDEP